MPEPTQRQSHEVDVRLLGMKIKIKSQPSVVAVCLAIVAVVGLFLAIVGPGELFPATPD